MAAHPEVQWMATMSPVRDTSSNEDPQPLKRPFVGHEHYRIGTYMMDKCLEYGAENWPDVDMKDVGVIVADYSIVAALHDRQRGAYDTWVAKYPEYEDHFFTLDCASGGMDADTARNLVQPAMSTNSQFTHWMIVAVHEDYAIGASAAVDSLDLTDESIIVDMGGSGLVKIFDAGVEDAWRFADYTAQTIYLEPIMGAMYAFMAGYATPNNIWPQWINANDHGADGDTYAGYLLPLFWLDKDNYKEYLAWSDVYAYADSYPQYPRDGITRDLYSTVVPVPDYYK
jgi:ABC-type sugar transport system substrate-binding protein